jgi:hypothetical protein
MLGSRLHISSVALTWDSILIALEGSGQLFLCVAYAGLVRVSIAEECSNAILSRNSGIVRLSSRGRAWTRRPQFDESKTARQEAGLEALSALAQTVSGIGVFITNLVIVWLMFKGRKGS